MCIINNHTSTLYLPKDIYTFPKKNCLLAHFGLFLNNTKNYSAQSNFARTNSIQYSDYYSNHLDTKGSNRYIGYKYWLSHYLYFTIPVKHHAHDCVDRIYRPRHRQAQRRMSQLACAGTHTSPQTLSVWKWIALTCPWRDRHTNNPHTCTPLVCSLCAAPLNVLSYITPVLFYAVVCFHPRVPCARTRVA